MSRKQTDDHPAAEGSKAPPEKLTSYMYTPLIIPCINTFIYCGSARKMANVSLIKKHYNLNRRLAFSQAPLPDLCNQNKHTWQNGENVYGFFFVSIAGNPGWPTHLQHYTH